MSERPIIFSAPMVRAILDGRKSQTRRIVKPQAYVDVMGNACWNGSNFGQNGLGVPHINSLASPLPYSKTKRVLCPYGAPGDVLWVRETWQCVEQRKNGQRHCLSVPLQGTCTDAPEDGRTGRWIEYAASPSDEPPPRWRPSIHMPRWASRITLEITGVRVERLQDISDDDLAAEGIQEIIDAGVDHDGTPRDAYLSLWESINGAGSWSGNPWVWVISFKRVPQ